MQSVEVSQNVAVIVHLHEAPRDVRNLRLHVSRVAKKLAESKQQFGLNPPGQAR